MARNTHSLASTDKLRLDTRPTPARPASHDSELKVDLVDSSPEPPLEDVVEGEVLELSAQDVDTPARSPVGPPTASFEAMTLQHSTPPSSPRPHSETRSRARAHSDSDRTSFDSVTGQPLSRCRTPLDPHIYRPGQARYPLLQATVDELAYEHAANLPAVGDRISSHRSSPVLAAAIFGAAGPPIPASGSNFEHDVLTPLTASSPLAFPTLSQADAASVPQTIVRRSTSGAAVQRVPSSRRVSRRSSARSDMSNTSNSPASAFLSQLSGAAAPAPELDEEGQQIGDQGEYVIGQQIGFGGFSIIKEVFKLEGGQRQRFAVKIVRKQVVGKDALENERFQHEAEHEVSIWRHLKHPNILPLISIFDTPFARFCIMPLTPGGTLLDLVRRFRKTGQASPGASPCTATTAEQAAPTPMPVSLVRRYVHQLARAIRHLHQDMRIVHRDIKLENCLLDQGGTLLLCDFGMADFHDPDARDAACGRRPGSPGSSWEYGSDSESDRPHSGMGPSETSTSITGSLPSASPELIRASGPVYQPSVDMWAFGVICYTLIVGRLPFHHAFAPTLQLMILKGDWDRDAVRLAMQARGEDEDSVSAAVALVNGCLDMNAQKRWTIGQVMSSRFIRS